MSTANDDAGLELLRLRAHLLAIFRCDCTCTDDTCAACIAEHALYLRGDHPAAEQLYGDAKSI
jgi:hypothetical protein